MDLAVGISQHTTGKKKTLPSNTIDENVCFRWALSKLNNQANQKRAEERSYTYQEYGICMNMGKDKNEVM